MTGTEDSALRQRVSGRAVLITGASSGIGEALANRLGDAGAKVLLVARSVDKLEEMKRDIEARGGTAFVYSGDLSNAEDTERIIRMVLAEHDQVDILVNNAGISHIKPSTEYDAKAWSRSMDTNLLGPFLCSRELGKAMIERGEGGSIINISSLNGQVGMPIGMAAYATSKVGVLGLTRSLAVEWGPHRIRVNAILPGNMDEGMMEWVKDTESPAYQAAAVPILSRVPLGSFGSADDIKGAVVYLASDASRYVSGEQILLDGAATINGGS
jgi:NAD(P)-dependent dehydrogenase (short-subunit alcohol dehydrogenase family)